MSQLDLALIRGHARTLDATLPTASAVGVAEGTIRVVGSDAEVLALCGASTEVIDLEGATVVPGLVDSHMHPFKGATWALGVDLLDARTLDDVRAGLSAERAKCGPGDWIRAWGLNYDVFADAGILSEVIDDAVDGLPAAVMFVDAHTMLASTAGLVAAGINGPREFAEHAEIVCEDGRPTGELRENAAMDVIRAVMPTLTAEDEYQLNAAHLRALAAVGLTGTHAMDGTLQTLALLEELESRGDLVTRIRTPFTIEPDTPEEMWERYAAAGAARGRRWKGGVAKFFIDGVIDTGTGWLVDPDEMGDGQAPFWPDVQRYRRAVAFFTAHGFQCVTHATGDRGVREALDAYQAAGTPGPGVRHRVEHIETIQKQDLPRFAAEGVIASMQVQHMMWLSRDRSDNWSRRLGDDRCDRAFLTRSLRESGARITLGSDWPVARFDPREGMAATRLRRPPGRPQQAPYDDQALDGLGALHGYTTGPAYAAGEEDRLGKIASGFLADLSVFAADPVDADADTLAQLPVRLTVVDGEVVYRA